MSTSTFIPARAITITVASYNSGSIRTIRVTGPSGEASLVTDPSARSRIIAFAQDVVASELAVALGQIDGGELE